MTAPVTAIIADDEPNLANYLRQSLSRLWPELQVVAIARNGLEALAALREHEPDIAFLDIKMPGLSGLDVARQAGDTRCVFVTAHDEFAVAAFDRNAVDYLLKPYSDARLSQTIDKLRAGLPTRAVLSADLVAQLRAALGGASPGQRLSWIRAGQGSEIRLIAVDEVCYFHAADKYTSVMTADAAHLIRTPLKELLEQLDPNQFWQVHRATVVNVREIREARRDLTGKVTLTLKSRPETLAVSRAWAHLFKQM
jgi:DNA-binding LytR/AlgR family response regulator